MSADFDDRFAWQMEAIAEAREEYYARMHEDDVEAVVPESLEDWLKQETKGDQMTQANLDLYPNTPGTKRTGTSKLAADSMRARAPTLRDRVLQNLQFLPMTADQVAMALGQSILSIRPRLSELVAQGKIVETSERRRNQSGKLATVWRAV